MSPLVKVKVTLVSNLFKWTQRLKYKPMPFRNIDFVVHSKAMQNAKVTDTAKDMA